jgi:prepilin-type processing-associated H-X9-DG protein
MQVPSQAASTAYIQIGALYPMVNSTDVYHCPGDKTQVMFAGKTQNRVRSYSMSYFMNGNDAEVQKYVTDGFRNNHKSTDIRNPAMSIVVCEEGMSLDDAQFGLDPELPGDPSFSSWTWQNVPAFYHKSSTAFSFADGHAEMHRWVNGAVTTLGTLDYAHSTGVADPTTDHTDITWVKQHMATR